MWWSVVCTLRFKIFVSDIHLSLRCKFWSFLLPYIFIYLWSYVHCIQLYLIISGKPLIQLCLIASNWLCYVMLTFVWQVSFVCVSWWYVYWCWILQQWLKSAKWKGFYYFTCIKLIIIHSIFLWIELPTSSIELREFRITPCVSWLNIKVIFLAEQSAVWLNIVLFVLFMINHKIWIWVDCWMLFIVFDVFRCDR